ncbi:unnamed protein product [Withania somnifera]
MEEGSSSKVSDGTVKRIKFGLATPQEICKSSVSDCPITHPSLLLNPFLGLPLEAGRCESCGTAEPGQCEDHFGYIELPIPIYHPDHVSELKKMLSLLCLKCLKMKNRKFQVKHFGVLERMLSSCCEDVSQISVNEGKTSDGASYLELKVPKNSAKLQEWNFLEKYGYRYGDGYSRPLLPSEVLTILRRIREDTRKKLSAKGYFPQEGYILQYLPVPPNCLSVPDISDGNNIMSSDHSITMLRKVLRQIDIIKSSRSGTPNFEAHEVEANDLQATVVQYFQFRGTGKASRDVDKRFGINKEAADTTTKAWLEKMKTLFIRKGSGFSSRSVITGDPYKGVGEIGLPCEIAQKITFEERVSQHNMAYLQKLVDEKLCLTYKDGSSTYSLREGSKGHTFLRPGQIVHRRIMDGDTVFINRPPTTHKHSLQALSVYVHNDHTVKINPLMCGPLSADFDGDCIHLFYPQSLSAKAEVLELFSVGKQLLSSHTGNFNLQLATDSLLSLKLMFSNYFFHRAAAQQLAMFLQMALPDPAVVDVRKSGTMWTTLQILGTALPDAFDSCGDTHIIGKSQFLIIDYNRDLISSILNDVITSIYFMKGPNDVLNFFNSLQPLLMENLCTEGFSISLQDFYMSKAVRDGIQERIQCLSQLLYHLRSSYNESVEVQLEHHLRDEKLPVIDFVLKSSGMGVLIDSKSESAFNKVVQQIAFLGLQISDRGKFYSKTLVNDMAQLFQKKYPSVSTNPSEEFGLVRSCLFYGLDPYQEMVHSISIREVIVRSTRGLTEPGTLFKNLMAILRDVVICYDGTIRNLSSNSIIQFEYGAGGGSELPSEFCAGDPVGVLAATAISNPAYKAVLDSSPSSNSSWEMMKEILLCGVSFKNDLSDRRVILYLNDCGCRGGYCREEAAYVVKNQLSKVCLKDAADEFLIEYGCQQGGKENSETGTGLIGHIHLNQRLSTSVTMVTKDVLKDHLVLLANSMTCTGNLIGFNAGGIKALSRSLNVQIPFTEATLFTPRKCFERSAEKCHVDSLSSIVASCSWGKHVAVGTGSRFELLLNTRNVEWNVPDAGDVYSFLHLVRSSSAQEVEGTSCLGAEVDELEEDEDMGLYLSPNRDSGSDMPTFEDRAEFDFNENLDERKLGGSEWEKASSECVKSGGSWDMAGETQNGAKKGVDQSDSWFSWGKKSEDVSDPHQSGNEEKSGSLSSWEKNVEKDGGSWAKKIETHQSGKEEESGSLSSWDRKEGNGGGFSGGKKVKDGGSWDKNIETENSHQISGKEVQWSSWNKQVEKDGGSSWAKKVDEPEDNPCQSGNGEQSGSWSSQGKEVEKGGGSWSKKVSWNGVQSGSCSSWGKQVEKDGGSWCKKVETHQSGKEEESGSLSSWGKKKEKDGSSSWAKNLENDGGSWGNKVETESSPQISGKEEQWSSWNKQVEKDGGSSWRKEVDEPENNPHQSGNGEQSGSWSSQGKKMEKDGGSSWAKNLEKDGGSWVNVEIESSPQISGKEEHWSSWNKRVEEDGGSSWAKKVDEPENNPHQSGNGEQSGSWSSWGKKVEKGGGSWEGPKQSNSESSWGKASKSGGLGSATGEGNRRLDQSVNDWNSSISGDGQLNESTLDDSTKNGGWDSQKVGVEESDKQPQWGQRKRNPRGDFKENSRGWGSGSGGEWKNNRPARSAGDSNRGGNFTATRQKMDIFTAEEQDILSDVDPIMLKIRKIMHATGYNDGDPLPADDQSYIIDTVLNYHADKAVKMGAGLDYIMVSKHTNFQDTRCFYVVSTDGAKQDFSTRKCLENYIRSKYPDKAETFNDKYFKKPPPRIPKVASPAPAPSPSPSVV